MKITRTGLLIVLLLGCVAGWLALVAIEWRYREPPDYALIEDGLYLGGHVEAPPPGTTAVLNLCEWEDPYECEHHVCAKIRDAAPAPSIDWLRKQVEFVAASREAGRTTYVHCLAGASRSSLVVCAYLMSRHQWTRDEALAHMRARRSQVRPNPAFMELLAEWEETLNRSGK